VIAVEVIVNNTSSTRASTSAPCIPTLDASISQADLFEILKVSEYSLAMRRDELLAAAMQLFAQRGYQATSIADIQFARGPTSGSGALYKRFPSKKALVPEGVHRYLADLEKFRVDLVASLPPDRSPVWPARQVRQGHPTDLTLSKVSTVPSRTSPARTLGCLTPNLPTVAASCRRPACVG
jgi:hypothetical protein